MLSLIITSTALLSVHIDATVVHNQTSASPNNETYTMLDLDLVWPKHHEYLLLRDSYYRETFQSDAAKTRATASPESRSTKSELATKRRSASDRPSTTSTYQDYNNSCLYPGFPTATAVGSGGGGVIVDLGTTVTRLETAVRDRFRGVRGVAGGGRGGAVPHALRSESAEERERADVGLGFRGDIELSRTPSGDAAPIDANVADVEGADDSSGLSAHAKDEMATLFPGGPANLSLLLSFQHHVLVEIWRNKDSQSASTTVLNFRFGRLFRDTQRRKRSRPRANITAENAIAMVDAVIALLFGVEEEEEEIVTTMTTYSDGVTTSTAVGHGSKFREDV
ncbi:hypothetical protein Syun_023804 [Stephania yunnanensis]|uniref:Uncharacterized protein n=1 Tax=Stephania yunnanensis TaxID=152371 RepID=A0AAP0FI37_9MAGN